MKQLSFILFSLLLSSNLLASTTASLQKNTKSVQAVTDSKWNALVQHIANNGKLVTIDILNYLYLENTVYGANGKDHTSDYISLVGYVTDGVYTATHLEVVSEKWIIGTDGNWHIDQWLYKVSGEAELKWAGHIDMIQTQDRQVLKHEYVPETDESFNSAWNVNLNSWYEFIKQ